MVSICIDKCIHLITTRTQNRFPFSIPMCRDNALVVRVDNNNDDDSSSSNRPPANAPMRNLIDASTWKIVLQTQHIRKNVSQFSVCTEGNCVPAMRTKIFVHNFWSLPRWQILRRSFIRNGNSKWWRHQCTKLHPPRIHSAQCSGRISLILSLQKRMPMHFSHTHTVVSLSLCSFFVFFLCQCRHLVYVYALVHRNAKKGSNCRRYVSTRSLSLVEYVYSLLASASLTQRRQRRRADIEVHDSERKKKWMKSLSCAADHTIRNRLQSTAPLKCIAVHKERLLSVWTNSYVFHISVACAQSMMHFFYVCTFHISQTEFFRSLNFRFSNLFYAFTTTFVYYDSICTCTTYLLWSALHTTL